MNSNYKINPVQCLKLLFVLCFYLFLYQIAKGSDLESFAQIRSNSQLQKELKNIIEVAFHKTYEETAELPKNLSPFFKKRIGIFVTAKKGDETRGCMGALQSQQKTLTEEILKNLKLAFTKDLRHKPIQKNELESIEIYITAIGNRSSVQDVSSLSPIKDGVLIQSGNKEAVLLPGEAKTQRYLLAFLKAKAGIKKKEPYQLYRLETMTVKAFP